LRRRQINPDAGSRFPVAPARPEGKALKKTFGRAERALTAKAKQRQSSD
jgi:hypothetical protein